MNLRVSASGPRRESSISMSSLNHNGHISRGHQDRSPPQQHPPQGSQPISEAEQERSPFSSSRNTHSSTTGIESNTGMPYHSRASPTHDNTTSQATSDINDVGYSEAAPSPETYDTRSNTRLVENPPYHRTSEQTRIRRKDLGVWNVASLIINKQIGTGIFTTPGLVLSLTGSKTVSLALWIVGGVWAALSVVVYVEFGVAFPYNGGELIYLDEVFKRPELLSTLLFSAFFICCPNTDGNALQFAKHVLLSYAPDAKTTEDLDKSMITLLAITVLTFVCLIHYFSRNGGLFLNSAFSIYKICLVSAFIIAGFDHARKHPGPALKDWTKRTVDSKGSLTALIYVIYSYQGWENANYVGGELKIDRTTLRNGAFLAVGITTILYTLVTSAYSAACTFEDLAGQDLGVISKFAPLVFKDVNAIKIAIAMSAFGNLLAVVYTSARVKQQIARQCILPFYKFFAMSDAQFETPSGALVLHWIFATIWIIVTPNTSSGYGFVIGTFIYGQLLVGVGMGFALLRLRKCYEKGHDAGTTRPTIENSDDDGITWHPVILKQKLVLAIVSFLFTSMNILALVESARGSGHPPRSAWPIVMFGLGFLVCIYWLVLRLFVKKSNENSWIHVRIAKLGDENTKEEDKPALTEAKLQENSRIVVYKINGWVRTVYDGISTVIHWTYKTLVAR